MLGDFWDSGTDSSAGEDLATAYIDGVVNDPLQPMFPSIGGTGGNLTGGVFPNITPVNMLPDFMLPDSALNNVTPQQAAALFVQGSAQAGVPVSAAALQSLQQQAGGALNLNSLTTAAGAIFKLVRSSSGTSYQAVPVNAKAQSVVSGNNMGMMMLAAAALFFFLRK